MVEINNVRFYDSIDLISFVIKDSRFCRCVVTLFIWVIFDLVPT